MDEELKGRLIGYLDFLEASAKTGGEFVAEQAPQVAQEFIAYHIAINGAGVAGGVLMLVAAAIAARRLPVLCSRTVDCDDKEANAAFASVCLRMPIVIVGLFGLPVIYSAAPPLLKAILAPRVLILEEISKLL